MKMPLQMRRWEDQLPAKQRRRMRKGMYILPSLFTAANIGAGYYAITETLQANPADSWRFDRAAIAIVFEERAHDLQVPPVEGEPHPAVLREGAE